jgi:hypothetical protein
LLDNERDAFAVLIVKVQVEVVLAWCGNGQIAGLDAEIGGVQPGWNVQFQALKNSQFLACLVGKFNLNLIIAFRIRKLDVQGQAGVDERKTAGMDAVKNADDAPLVGGFFLNDGVGNQEGNDVRLG